MGKHFVEIILEIIIAAAVAAIFSESIKRGISQLLSKIELPKLAAIEGDWKATFTIIEKNGTVTSYCETIRIVKRLGTIYGYNIPDANNYPMLKKVETKKPLRLRGYIVDNRFLTGIWFNPNRKSRFHGSFQLLYNLSGESMNGIWTGYSELKKEIESG